MIAMKDDKGRRMISCRDAAEKYGCTMRYIRKLALAGKLDHEIQAGSYMVSEADVLRLKADVAKGKGRHKPKAERFKEG